MKIILSHPTCNSSVRSAANAFREAKLLYEFHTAIACFPGDLLYRLGGVNMLSDIRRRSFNLELKPYTKSFPWKEAARLMATKARMSTLVRNETGTFSMDKVYHGTDKRVADRLRRLSKFGVNAVYAYEDGAVNSFVEAKRLGMQCFYDLPIGYWRTARRILDIERNKWPDWAATLTNFDDSEEKLARKDHELSLADKIIVGSQFTADSLRDFPGSLAPVKIVPYAFPTVHEDRSYRGWSTKRKLKLLFVGGLSQRKGIADLFAVADKFKLDVDLTIVGLKTLNACAALDHELAKHRWIPSIPNTEILKLMRENDVLVFPSHFEGFGLVITEAMSQGMPVITTERTAGPDIIKHDESGWVINAGDTEALQEVINKILQKPAIIESAGRAAMKTAKERSWKVYEKELLEAIAN